MRVLNNVRKSSRIKYEVGGKKASFKIELSQQSKNVYV